MAISNPTTPRRQSRRFQPVVTPSRHHDSSDTQRSSSSNVRLCKPYHTRAIRPSDLPDGTEWDEDKYQGFSVQFCAEMRRRKRERSPASTTAQLRKAILRGEGSHKGSDDEQEVEREDEEDEFETSTPRTRVSARMRRKGEGKKENEAEQETFRVGDTVLVETAHKFPSIAVITSIWALVESSRPKEKEVVIKLHWFLRPSQLPTVRAKRVHEPAANEIYFTLSATASISPSSLFTHCIVSSTPPPSKPSKPASSRVSRKIQDKPDEFFCQFAVDNTRGLFYTFDWDAHRAHALVATLAQGKTEKAEEEGTAERTSGSRWVVEVKKAKPRRSRESGSRSPSRSPSPRKRRRLNAIKEDDEDAYVNGQDDEVESDACTETDLAPSDSENDGEADIVEEDVDDSDDSDLLKTPSKRKRGRQPASPTKRTPSKTTSKSTPRTPRKSRTHIAAPTPHSKAALRARARAQGHGRKHRERDPGDARGAQGYYTAADLSSVPPDPWLRAQQALHVAARPGALPCRDEEFAKTLRTVEGLIEEGSGGCVYISGVPGTGKTATVHAVVRELKRRAENNESNPFTYVEINGLRVPEPAAAYTQLWTTLSSSDPDYSSRMSSKEALKRLHRHFAAGGAAGPRCATVVLMDELDQLVTAKQDVVYNFFNWPTIAGSKLIVLAVANTMDLPERVMSGRVRSRLGMSRVNFQPYEREQLISIIESRLALAAASLTSADTKGTSLSTTAVLSPDAIRFASSKTASISGDARRVLDVCRRAVELAARDRRCANMNDITEVVKAMQGSSTALWIKGCSLHERLVLAAIVRVVKNEGVEEVPWAEVRRQHTLYVDALIADGEPSYKPSSGELTIVIDGLLAARAVLLEDEASGGVFRTMGERRVVLNLEQNEVERVLGDIGGQRWKNALGVGR